MLLGGEHHGYEWGLSKNLTSIKTRSQLNSSVTLSDYYSIITKYLKMKNVVPSGRIMQDIYVENLYNGAIEGLVNEVNYYIGANVKSLTPQQYRVVEELIDDSKRIMDEQIEFLDRDNLKDLNLYLDLAKYRAATLLAEDSKIEREYKNSILYKLRNTKYASSLEYGILPMCGEISRGSFLVLMHDLLSNNTSLSEDEIIKAYNEAGVLVGYDNSLYLNQNLKYSEMLTFLYRFEAYDFNPTADESEEDIEEE